MPVVREFDLPEAQLQTIIDGMAMDLDQSRYLDFAALERYCHRVAGVVGLLSAKIFGYAHPATLGYARDLGIAFQLTNIVRDVGEDARRGRIYLPQEDLAKFGVAPSSLAARSTARPFRALMAFEAGAGASMVRPRLAQLDPRRPPRAADRASSWRRSTARCSTRSSATATACSTAGSR